MVNELIFGACHTCLRNVTKKNHHSPFGKLRTPIIRFAVINIGRMDPLRKWAKLSVVLDGTRNVPTFWVEGGGHTCLGSFADVQCVEREKKNKRFLNVLHAVKCG